MNPPIVRLYGLILLLFAALVGFTSYWAVFDSDEPQGQPAEPPPADRGADGQAGHDQDRRRGARSPRAHPVGGGKHPVYVRHYPQGSLFGNPVGYSFVEVGQTGIERSENGLLAGERTSSPRSSTSSANVPQEGDDITLTIDAQRPAGRHPGAAVGDRLDRRGERRRRRGGRARPLHRGGQGDGLGARLRPEPRSRTRRPSSSSTRTSQRAARQPAHPEHLPAGLDDEGGDGRRGARLGRVHARARCSAAARRRSIGGVPLSNAGGEQFGDIDMTTALTHSVNTYFAQVGEKLGTDDDVRVHGPVRVLSATRELDYPDDQMAPSGVYDTSGNLLDAGDAIDIGRVAIGQERLLVDAAADGRGGGDGRQRRQADAARRSCSRSTDPDGRTIEKLDPHDAVDGDQPADRHRADRR